MTFTLEYESFSYLWALLAAGIGVTLGIIGAAFGGMRERPSSTWALVFAIVGWIGGGIAVFVLLCVAKGSVDAAHDAAFEEAIHSIPGYTEIAELPNEPDTYLGLREDGTAQKFFLRDTGQTNTYQVVELNK